MLKTIIASEGHILTNGTVYGSLIHLGDGVDASNFREITREEYDFIMAENEPSEDDATAEDYKAELAKWGVDV